MSFESASIAILLLAALAILGLVALMTRMAPRAKAADALGSGDFAAVVAADRTAPGAGREDLFATAVAAKHLLQLDRAETLLIRITDDDPEDGEAWMERGLVAAYRGDAEAAADAFSRAESQRSDLLESITLHRAWLALTQGDLDDARRRFEEVETSLENKLRDDLGGGEPLFAEWFLQAADLWRSAGDGERAEWARSEGEAAAPESLLARSLASGRRPPLVHDATAPPA